MQVNNSPNFTGFYKIPQKSEEFTKLVSSCCEHKKESVIILNGNYPFFDSFEQVYEKIANENGGGINWLRNNAKKYGINIPQDDKNTTLVITSQKDVVEFLNYYKKYSKSLISNFGPLSRIKFLICDTLRIGKDADLPLYLKIVKHLAQTEEKFIKIYNEYLSNKNVINISSFEEFLEKI